MQHAALGSEPLAAFALEPRRAAVLLDIDGTLAPIVDDAAEASVPEATRLALIDVSRRFGLVACVSGRRASEARGIVGLGTITYLGNHGGELLRAGWTEPDLDPALEAWLPRIAEFRERSDTPELRRLRVRIEDKQTIAAYHWRAARDEPAAQAAVEELAARAEGEGLRTHWGRKVLEVRPPVEIDKGAAVKSLLDGTDVAAALYVGDDRTDLDAFRALRELAGDGRLERALCLAVGSEEAPAELVAEADVVLAGPEGVRSLLVELGGAATS